MSPTCAVVGAVVTLEMPGVELPMVTEALSSVSASWSSGGVTVQICL